MSFKALKTKMMRSRELWTRRLTLARTSTTLPVETGPSSTTSHQVTCTPICMYIHSVHYITVIYVSIVTLLFIWSCSGVFPL